MVRPSASRRPAGYTSHRSVRLGPALAPILAEAKARSVSGYRRRNRPRRIEMGGKHLVVIHIKVRSSESLLKISPKIRLPLPAQARISRRSPLLPGQLLARQPREMSVLRTSPVVCRVSPNSLKPVNPKNPRLWRKSPVSSSFAPIAGEVK